MNTDAAFAGSVRDAAQTPIRTRRLILRAPVPADISALTRLINDPLIAASTGRIIYPYPPIEAWRFIRAISARPETYFAGAFLMTLRGNPRQIVGGAGYQLGKRGVPELGYWVARAARRRGFAGEAIRALLQRIFTASEAPAVRAYTTVDNAASQRLLMRAGFRRVGRAMLHSRTFGRFIPMIDFASERKEWRNRHERDRAAREGGKRDDADV